MNADAHPQTTTPDSKPLVPIKERLDYAMKHFTFIADQRIKTFNFYVILLAASTGATLTAAQKVTSTAVFVTTGLLHISFAAIFFVIDQRSRRLLAVSKVSLLALESSDGWPEDSRLVVRDSEEMKNFWNRVFSYTSAFRVTFILQLILGLAVIYCGVFIEHSRPSTLQPQQQLKSLPIPPPAIRPMPN